MEPPDRTTTGGYGFRLPTGRKGGGSSTRAASTWRGKRDPGGEEHHRKGIRRERHHPQLASHSQSAQV